MRRRKKTEAAKHFGGGSQKQSDQTLLAAAQELRPSRGAQNPGALATHYETIRTAMRGVFRELGLAA